MGPLRQLGLLKVAAIFITAVMVGFGGYLQWLDHQEPEGPDTSSYRIPSSKQTGTCPDGYRNAGRTFSYDPEEDVGAIEGMFMGGSERDYRAYSKAIDRVCGDRVETGVCPDDRPNAGKVYEYNPDEYDRFFAKSMERLVNDECGLTELQEWVNEWHDESLHRHGDHCRSIIDGNFNALEDLVRPELHDPSSMDTVETRMGPANEDGQHPVELVFRASTIYGGTATLSAFGYADAETCEAELLWIE